MEKEEIQDWKQATLKLRMHPEWDSALILRQLNLGVLICKKNVNLSIYQLYKESWETSQLI